LETPGLRVVVHLPDDSRTAAEMCKLDIIKTDGNQACGVHPGAKSSY